MRAALISIAGQPHDGDGKPLAIGGKTLARRQLDFALAAGCERVIAIGDGAGAEAIALRHAAEGAGARFQVVANSHGLLGSVRSADELLVLAPGVLPEAQEAIEALAAPRALLVLPAGAGTAAGFERIDLERAWAGVAVVAGAQVERLAELPPDTDAASALMRLALQAGVPERRLTERFLADGSWTMPGTGGAAEAERAWLKRHLPAEPAWKPSRWLAWRALQPLSTAALALPRSGAALFAVVAILSAGAVGAAASGWPAVGFALLALGALIAEFGFGLANLRDAPPFGRVHRWRSVRLAPWAVDAALLACAALAIEGDWLRRLFPALVLLAALHLPRSISARDILDLVRDRGVLAAAFAVAAALGLAEPAIMAVALVAMALHIARSGARRG